MNIDLFQKINFSNTPYILLQKKLRISAFLLSRYQDAQELYKKKVPGTSVGSKLFKTEITTGVHNTISNITVLPSHLRLRLPSCFFSSSFPTKIMYSLLLCSTHATCPTHLILRDLITRIVFGEGYSS